MPQIVPLQPVPNQTTQTVLANQNCQLNVYQTPFGLFMDVRVNDAPIVLGVICQDMNRIVRDLYFGFIGDFAFKDTQGLGADPTLDGLGSRFLLLYLTETEAGDI
jgi:hypothetical protein